MRKILIFAITLLHLINCGNGNGSNPPTVEEQAEEHIKSAWSFFENAEYDSAEYYFDWAISLVSNYPEGQAGKAWSKLLNEDTDFSTIENLLENALTEESLINDLYAALGIVNNLQKDYTSSVNYIDDLFDLAASYVFSHNTDINYQDLLVIQAHSYFYNKDFDKAYESILELTTEFSFDPFDSTTWIVDGDLYPSYEGAISAALAKVSKDYKSFQK